MEIGGSEFNTAIVRGIADQYRGHARRPAPPACPARYRPDTRPLGPAEKPICSSAIRIGAGSGLSAERVAGADHRAEMRRPAEMHDLGAQDICRPCWTPRRAARRRRPAAPRRARHRRHVVQMVAVERLIEDVARAAPTRRRTSPGSFPSGTTRTRFLVSVDRPQRLFEGAERGVQRRGDAGPAIDQRVVPVEQQHVRFHVGGRRSPAPPLMPAPASADCSRNACTQIRTQASNEKSCALSPGAKRSM